MWDRGPDATPWKITKLPSLHSMFDHHLPTSDYREFGKFLEGLFSRNFEDAEFRENKPSPNGENLLSFTDVGKSCQIRDFLTWQIRLLTLFAKINFSRSFPNLQ